MNPSLFDVGLKRAISTNMASDIAYAGLRFDQAHVTLLAGCMAARRQLLVSANSASAFGVFFNSNKVAADRRESARATDGGKRASKVDYVYIQAVQLF
ncbi:hypothetical protein [Paraburkholderia strydomiana]|uniref:hypothetical protein n=1 Tax=Paraburkholderia strydomiana TaxID=1245417 RepID=UPI00285D27BA|nr:hypothetical protein [Paraburkholderia strydomiana]MDR7008489.1 hypothetical protein [Paraburkholderia strydomiana]